MYVIKSNRTENYVADSSRVADGVLTFTSAQKTAMRFADKNVAQTLCNTQDAGFLRVVKLVPKAKSAPADPLPVASTVTAFTRGAFNREVYVVQAGATHLIPLRVRHVQVTDDCVLVTVD